MSKEVLFVSQTAEKGGAELVMMDLITHGPEDWGACFFTDGPAARDLAIAGREPMVLTGESNVLNIRRGASAFRLLSAAGGVLSLARSLAQAAQGYRVVCANSQKALFVAALATRFMRRPLVWFLHDILTDPAFSGNTRRAAVIFANLFASRVVVNSKATGRAFVAAGGRADRVRLVYCGFDLAAHPKANAMAAKDLRGRFGLSDAPVIGLFGRLNRWKGQHVLLRALAKLPDVQAIIVGAALFDYDGYEAELRELAHSEGLADRVHFTGFVEDVPNIMAGVDVVVHASTHPEPFGRVVVEGMLAGRPVVATRGGGVDEIVSDGETGLLVPPDDPPALAAAILRLLSEPAFAERIAQSGLDTARKRFSIERACRDMAAVLNEATGRR
jgi:glycosyltransferase involved in cell wall biosynthesis